MVYNGEFLNIFFEIENSLFFQKWINTPSTLDDFKSEMLIYTEFYRTHKPKFTLWDQTNFTLDINNETQIWIEKNVNEPCYEYGNKKCAFIVGKDVLAHVAVIDAFDKMNSCIIPKHFTTGQEARKWLKEEDNFIKEIETKRAFYEGVDKDGNIIIKMPIRNIKKAFKSLNNILNEEKFHEINNYKFNQLTKREKEILRLLSKGIKHKDIADNLFISVHTVRTHIKNIKLKLDITKNEDFVKFMNFFS